MIGRIILTVVVVIVGVVVVNVLEQKAAPQRVADLAVESVENPEVMPQLRIEQNAQNWLDPVCYLVTVGLLVGIWLNPVVKFCKEMNEGY